MTARELRIKRDMFYTILKVIIQIIFVCIAVFMIVGLIKLRSDTGIFGYTARVVISDSMEPTIEKNTLNIIKIVDIEDIKVDDIICFSYDNDIIHRVIKISEVNGDKVLYTQGDNNATADNIEITNEMLLGKVVKTFNKSNSMLGKYINNNGKIDTITLYKDVIMWVLIGVIIIYAVIKIGKFILIVVQAFRVKRDGSKSIRVLEKDIEELYIIKSLIEDIDNNSVKNNTDTRFEYISNKISRVRTEYAIKDIHRDITSMRRKVKNCYYFDSLIRRIESRDKENKANESDNSTT